MLQYVINTPEGPKPVSAQRVLYDAGEFFGLKPLGISSDGLNGIFQDPRTGATQEIPFSQLMQQVGIQVQTVQPMSFSVSPNVLKHKTVISSLPDPDARLAYAQTVARREFGPDAKVIEANGEYYAHNGQEWVSLTNEAGLGAEDIIGGAITGARLLAPAAASVAAGTLGIAGSPLGAIAAGAAGGALGRAATEAGLTGLAAAVGGDAARAAIAGNIPNIAKQIGKEALIEGAIGGIGGGIGNVASKALLSAGRGLTSTGSAIKDIGKFAETPVGRVFTNVVDPTGFTTFAGAADIVGSLGGAIGRGISKGVDWGTNIANKVLGKQWQAPNLWAREGFKKPFEAIEKIGRGIGTLGNVAETGVARAVQGIGSGVKGAGLATRTVGTIGNIGGERALLGQSIRSIGQNISDNFGAAAQPPQQMPSLPSYYRPVSAAGTLSEEQIPYYVSESGALMPSFRLP